MYRNEISQLKIAIEALDVLLEGTSNVYSSIESIRLNNDPIKSAINSLLYSRQELVSQLKILEVAQLKVPLGLDMEPSYD